MVVCEFSISEEHVLTITLTGKYSRSVGTISLAY